MSIDQIILLLAGLALLVFGMLHLSKSIQLIFSLKIRNLIKRLVKKPSKGVLLGIIMTALFQSSSASTVLTVGFVSAGLISFISSLAIVLGAIVGSTITAQLVALNITRIAPVFIIIGILIWLFSKGEKNKKKIVGEAIFYFGLLFFGLSLMADAMTQFQTAHWFMNFLSNIKNPVFGIIVGFIFTAIIQSSAATASILVILGQQGLISIQSAIPILLGANIGTTITAILSSIGSNINAKRTAYSHFVFKFVATILVLPFIGYFAIFLKSLNNSIGKQVALAHLLFSIFILLLFYFWLKPFSRIIKKIIPGNDNNVPLWTEYLNKDFLNNPKKALMGVEKEICRGIELVENMLKKSYGLIYNFNYTVVRDLSYIEIVIDSLQLEIMNYLINISTKHLTKKQANQIIYYSEIIDSIERISDHADNVAQLSNHKEKSKVHFSKQAKKEFKNIIYLLRGSVDDLKLLIKEDSKDIVLDSVTRILERENEVDRLTEVSKENHSKRFYKRKVPASDGPIFNDLLVNLERISDQCVNIARHYVEDH